MAHTWWWNTWNSTVAKSTRDPLGGQLHPQLRAGQGKLPPPVVTLSGVKYHNGRAYYSQMTWYTPGYRTFGSHRSTLVLHFSTQGGTVPDWH